MASFCSAATAWPIDPYCFPTEELWPLASRHASPKWAIFDPIHPSAWKGDSPYFACSGFSEVGRELRWGAAGQGGSVQCPVGSIIVLIGAGPTARGGTAKMARRGQPNTRGRGGGGSVIVRAGAGPADGGGTAKMARRVQRNPPVWGGVTSRGCAGTDRTTGAGRRTPLEGGGARRA